MKLTSVLSLIAIGLVMVLGGVYLAFSVVQVNWFTRYTYLTLDTTNSGGLMLNSPVLLSGVRVGDVTRLDNNVSGGVEISVRVADPHRIPVDSTVRIESLSGLGEPYLEVTPLTDGGATFRSGERLDARQVAAPVSLPEVAHDVTNALAQLDPESLSSLVATANESFADADGVIPGLARSTNLLAQTIVARMPEIRQLLVDLQRIGEDLDWAGPAMSAASPHWSSLGDRMGEVAGAIERFIAIGNVPEDYTNDTGIYSFVQSVTDDVNTIGPDIQKLTPVLAPLAHQVTQAASQIDIGTLIAVTLNMLDPDGGVQMTVTVK